MTASPSSPDVQKPKVLAEEDISGVVEVVSTEQGTSGYQTEFVKVYQDAGVIGVSMITLLALCLLLGLFSIRLLKMYVALTESRDRLEDKRVLFSEKLVDRLAVIDSSLRSTESICRELCDRQRETRDRLDEMDRNLSIHYISSGKNRG